MNERKDTWKPADDSILAETVLRHIREGSSQLKAFDEVGGRLNRTAAACGFRWNAEVRKKYEMEIVYAKQEKMNMKKEARNYSRNNSTQLEVLIENNTQDIDFISSTNVSSIWEEVKETIEYLENEINKLNKQLKNKDRELALLRQQLEEAQKPESIISEDYQQFIDILKRARQLGVLEHTV